MGKNEILGLLMETYNFNWGFLKICKRMIFPLGVNIWENKQMSFWAKQQIVPYWYERRRNSEKDSTSVNREVRKQSRRGGCLWRQTEYKAGRVVNSPQKCAQFRRKEQNINDFEQKIPATLDGASRVITITWRQKEAAESCQGDLVALKSI